MCGYWYRSANKALVKLAQHFCKHRTSGYRFSRSQKIRLTAGARLLPRLSTKGLLSALSSSSSFKIVASRLGAATRAQRYVEF